MDRLDSKQPFTDEKWMRLALELASRGEGWVEPNPMVGCALVRGDREIGRGFHPRFGGEHAEVAALRATNDPRGATVYVTLEPCCHQGKTGPCTDALIQAQIARVVAATADPFPQVSGAGFKRLRDAGIQVDVGICEREALRLNAPYFKRLQTGRPWVIAKWAMSLDGKIATHSADSRWVSGDASRAFVHQLRGRVDAIIVGKRTAQWDDPLLTARPSGPRTATRVVFDSQLEISLESQLVRSAQDAPVLLIARNATQTRRRALEDAGCQVLETEAPTFEASVHTALAELGRRNMTNVLVEGGGELLGAFFDTRNIDEVIAFVAPKLIGGQSAAMPLGGLGIDRMDQAPPLEDFEFQRMGDDVCLRGRVARRSAS